MTNSKTIKKAYSFAFSILFSLMAWLIIDNLLIEISIYKYIVIEILIALLTLTSEEVKKRLDVYVDEEE